MSKPIHTTHSFVIASNTASEIVFNTPQDLHRFAVVNSGRVASLLNVLAQVGQDIDGGFLIDMLKVTNDLAYEVEQAVRFVAVHADAGVDHG